MAQTILVDTTPGYRQPTIYYSQGDIGRTFAIDLQSRFGDSLPASPTITIQATKPSGLGFSVAATSISNSVATFTVTDTMTNEAGRFPAEIKVVKNSVTLYTANFYIECEKSAHPEGTTDGDLDSISPKFMSVTVTTLDPGNSATYTYDPATNTATFGIPKGEPGDDGTLSSNVIATTYSSSSTYDVGDFCFYNGSLYKCTTAITTAEAWTSGHWTVVKVTDEITDLKDDLKANEDLEFVPLHLGTWEVGSINASDGVPLSSNTRIRTVDYIDISKFDAISFDVATGYKFVVDFYKADNTIASVIDSTVWQTQPKTWDSSLWMGAVKIKVLVANTSDGTADISFAQNLNAYYESALIGAINQYADTIDNNLYKLIRERTFTSTKASIIYVPFKFKAGETYVFENTSPIGASVYIGASTTMTAGGATVESVTSGNLGAGVSEKHTMAHDAEYLSIYFSGVGTAKITQSDLVIENIEEDINDLSANVSALGADVNKASNMLDAVVAKEYSKTLSSTDSVAGIGDPFFSGVATRYRFPSDIAKVRTYCKFTLTENTDVVCEIRSGDFSEVLGSTKTEVSPSSSEQYIDFIFDTPIPKTDDNMYLCVYCPDASGGMLRSAGGTSTECTATSTVPNRYRSGGAWVYTSPIDSYCVYAWIYDIEYKPAFKPFIVVGSTEDCDYADVQSAIDNCNDSALNPVIIFIKNGTYDAFSFTDGVSRVRYISLIGESRENVIIRGDKGVYEKPTAEIRTIGAIKNITFIQETSSETQESGGQYNYCYALHDDYDDTNAEYENCTFISNAGPAVGIGTRANSMKVFRDCYFEMNGDGSFGSRSLGAFFGHSYWANANNQGLILENCTAINRSGTYGIYIDKLTSYTATFKAHIVKCGSFGNGVPSAYCTFDLTDSYGNNVEALNVF